MKVTAYIAAIIFEFFAAAAYCVDDDKRCIVFLWLTVVCLWGAFLIKRKK